jgi:hypothetical protein
MNTRLKLRLLIGCIAALTALSLPLQLATATGETAKKIKSIAPSVHGWWTQAYVEGIGSVQPDVPEKGMLVENAPTGPTAISALRFSFKDRATAKRLKLSIAGTPVISLPPVACVTTTKFESAQGGAWEDGPPSDCKRSVAGVINADRTEIRFAVKMLANRRNLSLVIFAGGPTDRIAFAKPGRDTLSLSIKAAPTSPPPPQSEPQAPSTVSEEPATGTGNVTLPGPLGRRDAPVAQPDTVAAAPSPVAQPPARPTADEIGGGEGKRALGTTLGVALLLLTILYWSDGFGAIGIRSSLAARLQEGKSDRVRRLGGGASGGQLNRPATTGTS